jgi:hypothetical protein
LGLPARLQLVSTTDINVCLSSYANSSTVIVVVGIGKDKGECEVEQAPLIRKSTLFRRAWIVRNSEGEVATMGLPGIEVRHFKLYQHWVHTSKLDHKALGYNRQKVPIPKFTNPLLNEPSRILTPNEENRIQTQSNNLANDLIHLWALGRLLGDDELQKTTMDELVEWYIRKTAQGVPSFISEQTLAFVGRITLDQPESPLRHFCVLWARHMFAIVDVDIEQFSETAPSWLSDRLRFSQPFEPKEGRRDQAPRQQRKKAARRARKAAAASVAKTES